MQDSQDFEPHELKPSANEPIRFDAGSLPTVKSAFPRPAQTPVGVETKGIPLGSGVITDQVQNTDTETIFQIRNDRSRATRVVKVLRADATHLMRLAFENESLLLSQLRHPNIILLKGAGYHQTLPFSELENVNGHTLRQLIDQKGALPPLVAMSIGVQILSAISYFHSKTVEIQGVQYGGILHRNITPESILVGPTGVVKVTGFGIATPIDSEFHTYVAEHTPGLAYFAPELLKGGKADRSSDLFSFGVLMYEMLAGVAAFSAPTKALLINARLNNRYTSLKKAAHALPAELERLVEGCLVTEPKQRAQEAEALFGELSLLIEARAKLAPAQIIEAFLDGGRQGVKAGGVSKRALPTPLLAGGGVLVAVLIAAAAYLFLMRGSQADPFHRAQAEPVAPAVAPMAAVEPTAKPAPRTPEPYEEPVLESAPDVRAEPAAKRGQVKSRRAPAQATPVAAGAAVAQMRVALKEHDWDQAIELYNGLSASAQQQDLVRMLRLRALVGKGDLYALGVFFSQNTIVDGEYYLHRARYSLDMNELTAVLNLLDRAETTPVAYSNSADIVLGVLYYRARALTGLYTQYPSSPKRAKAIEVWESVKFSYRQNPSHPRYIEAVQELDRLAVSP